MSQIAHVTYFFKSLYNEEMSMLADGSISSATPGTVRLRLDKYKGLHITIDHHSQIPEILPQVIDSLCVEIIKTNSFNSIWLDIANSHPRQDYTLPGFTRFRDYNKVRAFRWLSPTPCTIPAHKNFAVTAIIVDSTCRKILLVKDQFRWRLPQGFFDLELDDPEGTLSTLSRVCREQTGLEFNPTQFQLLQQLPMQHFWMGEFPEASRVVSEYQTGEWVNLTALQADWYQNHPVDPGIRHLIPNQENESAKKIKLDKTIVD